MIDYGQFCTVARGAEVLGELWTPLVVRELLCGSRRFNDIHRGVPRMSATLLTQRLRKLEALDVVERRRVGRGWEYHLTQAGEELRPIVVGLGHWGARWIGSRLKPKQLDAGFLMWDIRRFAQLDRFPTGHRVVIHFQFTDAPRGAHGFGYDPLFEVEDTGRTLAEMDETEKNAISHRARAVRALASQLAAALPELAGA